MIYRYSSRRKKLDQAFLNEKLKGAFSYDRIAGYFSSSLLEVAGEAIEEIEGSVRVVCNSEMQKEDVITAKAAIAAMRQEWCSKKPEEIYKGSPQRLRKLYDLLKSGKLQIKVVPNDVFGLIHGKAGVITLKDGSKTSFIGSVNESYSAWKLNYEILWEDDSAEGVNWVQEEFDYFWSSPYAVPLADFVVEDIKRISERKVIHSLAEWQEEAEPAPVVIETPVYRQELGLWEHQKYFVSLAFTAHQKYGARYVLADTVGLGKTIQLALTAELMALYGEKPILVIAPKALLWQWQDELITLLDMPSAVFNGKEWVDENGLKYPNNEESAIKRCPRRVGIVSQGLITANSAQVQPLLNLEYECVIVDEAHRARRRNLGKDKEDEKPIPNNLLSFLLQISCRSRSMLLATATPVQLYPIEAWDLLNVLAQGSDAVLGNIFSKWRKLPGQALRLIMGKEKLQSLEENWEWLRNPFPPADEDERTYGVIRNNLNMTDNEFVVKPEVLERLAAPDKRRIERIIEDNFMTEHNPFIRHIVRRTRDFLENTIDPETEEPYLKKVEVRLFGEDDNEALVLPPYLRQAYEYAEEFCALLQKRMIGGGFLKTLLLKRLGSTIIAGKNTAEKMLSNWVEVVEEEDEDEAEELVVKENLLLASNKITDNERELLTKFIGLLNANQEKDPKYIKLVEILQDENWLERGCIIFSQYYDSARWVAENLAQDLPQEKIGIYAGGDKAGIFNNGVYERCSKEEIKSLVKQREIRILVGTDAASEGLNLQTLGSLVNLDLPWNPTRLEQRKGRIQRIGQVYDEVYIYNMRYKDSVEDRVHKILSERFANIYEMFGQIPDVLEDVWIDVALNEIEEANRKIDALAKQHPFELRYQANVGKIDWESCTKVLDNREKKKYLLMGWK